MVPELISLIIAILVFCILAYALVWTCDKFDMPPPVKWACGALLLIVLLLWASANLGGVHLTR